jgi:hypothetical protein
MAQANYTGGCACRSVLYECSAEPIRMFNCHCRDCQRATGSSHAAVIVFPRDAVKLSGELKFYSSISERGTVLARSFCPTCGNPISMLAQALPGICLVYAPSLDDPTLFKPGAQIWTRSAQPWDTFDAGIPCHETRFP